MAQYSAFDQEDQGVAVALCALESGGTVLRSRRVTDLAANTGGVQLTTS
jgi:hypothetical protein